MSHDPTMVLAVAGPEDVTALLPLVAAYHRFEALELSDAHRRAALRGLLDAGDRLGRIWLVRADGRLVGYLAVCYGYSIEFAGRDAFIDEFYLVPEARGRGFGRAVLAAVQAEMRAQGIAALHLEVDRGNGRARRIYQASGFEPRDRYHLMTWTADPPQ